MYNDYKVTNTHNGLYKYVFDFEYTPDQLEAIILFYNHHSFFIIEPMEN